MENAIDLERANSETDGPPSSLLILDQITMACVLDLVLRRVSPKWIVGTQFIRPKGTFVASQHPLTMSRLCTTFGGEQVVESAALEDV